MMRPAACLVAAALIAPGAGSLDSAEALLSADRMRADVAFLSSRALAGRQSGSSGGEAAQEYIAAEMRKARIRPAAGGGYFQTIPLVQFEVDQENSSLSWTVQDRAEVTSSFRAGADFFCRFPRSTRVTAGVVFAGYGITAPEFAYDDYTGIDARGKFVVVLAGEPQRENAGSVFNGRGDTIYTDARVKTRIAEQHGAAGVLLIGGRSGPRALSASGTLRPAAITQDLIQSRQRIPLVSLFAPAAGQLVPSWRERMRKIDAALRPQSFELPGVKLTLDHRLARSERITTSSNVAGWIEGADSALRGETVLLTAHHDHHGAVPGGYFPGANDNASGTAGVIELARAFAASGLRPRRSILFVVFGSEEKGLLGSFYYVDHPLRPLDKTAAVVNLDMIGQNETPSLQTDGRWHVPADTGNALNPVGTHYSPDLRREIEAANEKVGLKLDFRLDADHALDIFQRCDHYPFALERIPSVWFFTGFHPEYHQTTDTVDRLNFPKMLKIVRLAMRVVWDLANQPERPRFDPAPGPVKETA